MSLRPINLIFRAFALCVVAACTADAQGLADVAKREAERRGTVSGAGKVYTNTDLVSDFTRPVAPPPAPAAPTPQKETAPQAASAAPTEEPPQVPVAAEGTEVERQAPSDKGEDYWRNKAAAIRSAISAQQAQIAALETRVQDLAKGKTAADRREGDLSSTMLAKAKADLAFLEQDKARFEDVAKSKNVPAAWLR
jgi:hypothetical protein